MHLMFAWLHWLCHAWQYVCTKGAHHYWWCSVCGERTVSDVAGLAGPIDQTWIATGKWTEQGPPPQGGSSLFATGKPRPRLCKNCGRPLRGLALMPEIPVHVDTESRWCGEAGDGPPRTDGP